MIQVLLVDDDFEHSEGLVCDVKNQETEAIALSVAEVRVWAVNGFGRIIIAAASDDPHIGGLAAIVRSGITELERILDRGGLLGHLPPAAAAELQSRFNHWRDRLDRQCRRNGESPAVMDLALSLVDEILEFLGPLVESAQIMTSDAR